MNCPDCKQGMLAADSCTFPYLKFEDRFYRRNTTYFDEGERCHDCGIVNKAGNVHHFRCDMERCPRCGHQLLLLECGCWTSASDKPTPIQELPSGSEAIEPVQVPD